ncbi:MAG: DNA polymerase III subunit beta [Vampirovibrionales bacterium]|nr:DNA polymerase III subunit beta [Vampirovibrionales bacterium]
MSIATIDSINSSVSPNAQAGLSGFSAKLVFQRDSLLQAVSAVARATSVKPIQPILSHILLEVDPLEQRATLSATDMDLSIRTWVSLDETTPQPVLALKMTLSAKKLLEILSKLPAASWVTLRYDPSRQLAKLDCAASTFELRTMPAEEFPDIASLPAAVEAGRVAPLQLPLTNLNKAIAQTVFAAASYDTNNVLGGVFFRVGPSGLELVATDGSRLARRMDIISAASDDMQGAIQPPMTTTVAIIPAKTLQEFTKLIGSNPEKQIPAQLAILDGQIYILSENFELISRLIDGQYPKFEQLIPTQNQIIVRANRNALIASLERASVMANERTNVVKLHLEADRLGLSANNPDVGDSKDEMPVEFDGTPMDIAFNYKYVLDALKAIDTEGIRMETNGALAPTIFKGDLTPEEAATSGDYLCLVMPVQVK